MRSPGRLGLASGLRLERLGIGRRRAIGGRRWCGLRPGRSTEPFGAGQRQARSVIAVFNDKATACLPGLHYVSFESTGVTHIGRRQWD